MNDYCAIFGSAAADEGEEAVQEAEKIGEFLAENSFNVLCGGFGGVMEAACRGNKRAGGAPLGIGLQSFSQKPNRYLTDYRAATTLGERLDLFEEKTGPVLGLPGGIGTITEVMFFWDLAKSGLTDEHPLILYGSHWEKFLAVLGEEFIVDDQHFKRLKTAENLAEMRSVLASLL